MLDCIGKKAVMDQFATFVADYPTYAVFQDQGKEQRYTYKGSDQDEATRKFEEFFTRLEESGTTARMICRYYDGENKITKNTLPVASFYFRVKQQDPAAYQTPSTASSGEFLQFLMQERLQLKEENQELKEGLEQLQEDLQALQEQPQSKNLGFIGQIGEVGQQYPWMQQYMGDIVYVMKKLFSGNSRQPQHSATMGNIPHEAAEDRSTISPDKRVNAALEILINYYVQKENGDKLRGFTMLAQDLELLAELTRDPVDFDYALSKLRQNFKK